MFLSSGSAQANEQIFVQVAAYRDAELLPTLRDCIAQAANPEQLTFGICWQRDEGDSLGEFAGMENVRLIDIPFSESRGACWARQQTQQLFRGEGYTLQIDSHHRFAPGWDAAARRLFAHARKRGAAKPLLTSYAPVYSPGDDAHAGARGSLPLRLVFDHFSAGGPVQVKPVEMAPGRRVSPLEPARFLSAHFLFTAGQFCHEVPYDPKMYFFGEEPSLAIRAYTHGYDLFHPREILLWHYYGRSEHARHWSDNQKWWLRNERSLLRYRRLVSAGGQSQALGEYGCGSVRSVQDYEQFTGLALAEKRVSTRALKGLPPAQVLSRWRNGKRLPEFGLTIDTATLTSQMSLDTAELLAVTAYSQAGREVFRRDFHDDALAQCLADGSIQLRVYAPQAPVKWAVTPWNNAAGWGEGISRSWE